MTQTQTDTTRAILLGALALLAIPVVMMLVMMPMMGAVGWSHMGEWSHMNGWMWDSTGGWVAMLLMMAIPLLLLVAIGYFVYRSLSDENGADDAMAELRRAYARGELSDEEFENRRKRLQNDKGV